MTIDGVLGFNLQILASMMALLGFGAVFFSFRNRYEEAELRRLLDELKLEQPSPHFRWDGSIEKDSNAALNEFMDTIRRNARKVEKSFQAYAAKYYELYEELSHVTPAIKICRYLMVFSSISAVISVGIAINTTDNIFVKQSAVIVLASLLYAFYWFNKHLKKEILHVALKYPTIEELLDLSRMKEANFVHTSFFQETVGVYLKLVHDLRTKGPRKGLLIGVTLPVPFHNFGIEPTVMYNIDKKPVRYDLSTPHKVKLSEGEINRLKKTRERTSMSIEFFHAIEELTEIDLKKAVSIIEDLNVSIKFRFKTTAKEEKVTDLIVSPVFIKKLYNPEARPNIFSGTFVPYWPIIPLSEDDADRILERDAIEIDKLNK